MKKILALLLIALCLGLCAAASADELKAPTDFAFDTESGKLSFVSNDENAGYYFVRHEKTCPPESVAHQTQCDDRVVFYFIPNVAGR